jgi:thioredoxin 1
MAAAVDSNTASTRFIVACLCAEWCSSCREYRATFDQVALEFAGVRFVWVDVEDQAALVDGIEVDNFPTVLIASGEGPLFLGPVTPQPDILVRLVRAHLAGEFRAFLPDSHLSTLLARLHWSKSE